MTPRNALNLARYYAKRVPHDNTALPKMLAALYMLCGPKRDGTMPFTLRPVVTRLSEITEGEGVV